MATRKSGSVAEKPTLRVGSPVSFQWGQRKVQGRIIEDRGPIGVGGRRLYGIEFHITQDEPMVVELPANEIEKTGE